MGMLRTLGVAVIDYDSEDDISTKEEAIVVLEEIKALKFLSFPSVLGNANEIRIIGSGALAPPNG